MSSDTQILTFHGVAILSSASVCENLRWLTKQTDVVVKKVTIANIVAQRIELNVIGNTETYRSCTITSSLTTKNGGLPPSFVYFSAVNTNLLNNLMVDFE